MEHICCTVKVIAFFGKLVYDAFDLSDPPYNPTDPDFMNWFTNTYFVNDDLGSTQKMYMITHGDQVVGFRTMKYTALPNGEKAQYMLLSTTAKELQSRGLGKKLVEIVLKNSDTDKLMGITHTPGTIKMFLASGKKTGFDCYFCGHKHADANQPLTAEERAIVDNLRTGLAQFTRDYGLGHLQEGMPDHYILYGENTMPPRRPEDLRFQPEDPVGQTFKELVNWQQKNRPGQCVYGSVFMIKKSASE